MLSKLVSDCVKGGSCKSSLVTSNPTIFNVIRWVLGSLGRTTLGPNVSTTPITAMGCRQCLPLSVVQLKDKHCRRPHCHNGVVDTFGPCQNEIWTTIWSKSTSQISKVWRCYSNPELALNELLSSEMSFLSNQNI